MLQHFFLENQLRGTAIRHKRRVHEELQLPYGYAFFCPQCARLWALCPIELQRTFPLSIECEACPRGIYPAGSLWQPLDPEFNEALPPELLLRELNLHLTHYEKGVTL